MNIQKAEVLQIVKDNKLTAIIWKDMESRHEVIYLVSEAGRDDIMELLKTNENPKNS